MALSSPAVSNAKYAPLEHEGLQVVPDEEIREKRLPATPQFAQEEETAPKYLASQRGPAYDGADAPESYAPQPQFQQQYQPYSNQYHDPTQQSPVTSPTGNANKEAMPSVEAADQTPKKRKYCGLSKGLFIGLIVLLIFVILAVVLGATLGTVLPNKNKGFVRPILPMNGDSSNLTTVASLRPAILNPKVLQEQMELPQTMAPSPINR